MNLLFDSDIVNLLLKTKGGETEGLIMLILQFGVLWGWFRVEILTWFQIVTGVHRCFSTCFNRGCFEIGYPFHKNLKYWNSWHRSKKNKKQWSKITEKIISTYLINVYVWKKMDFKNAGGKINLSGGQTQMAAHSLLNLAYVMLVVQRNYDSQLYLSIIH